LEVPPGTEEVCILRANWRGPKAPAFVMSWRAAAIQLWRSPSGATQLAIGLI
jgi:hypothetical protein